MAAYDFPSSPSLNQQFTPEGGPTWRWNGSAWLMLGGVEGPAPSSPTLVSAIEEPPPQSVDGTLWYDPSTGTISVWYGDAWYPEGTPTPSSPTPAVGQQLTVSVGPVATLVKLLDLPVTYFDGGNNYWAQFPNALAAGWADPDFFPLGIWLSPAQPPYAANTAEAGINFYNGLEGNIGNIAYALAAGIHCVPQQEWTPDQVDAEDGDNDPRVVGWNVADESDMFSDLATLQASNAYYKSLNDGRFTFTNVGNGLYRITDPVPLWSPFTVDDMVRTMDVACHDGYFYSSPGSRFYASTSDYWSGPGLSPEEARRSAAYGWACDQLRSFQDPGNVKPYWNFIETARPFMGPPENYLEPTPPIALPHISGAAWSSIRHGARGIMFFQHNDDPSIAFYSVAEESSTVIRGHVAALTAEITSFAAVLNGPTYDWDFGDSNIETMLKAHEGYAYIFAGPSLSAPISSTGSDIEQTGDTLEFQFTSTAETGTVSSAITVPDNAELVVVTVSGLHGTANGFASMTFTKGATDTAMVKATGGDVSGGSWQSAIFTQVLPDTGASKSLKWDWLGAASDGARTVSVSFWRGLDLNNPVRDSNGVQSTSFALETPILVETPVLEIGEGDRVLAFCGMNNPAADGSATVNVWHHLSKLSDLTHQSNAEGALATGAPDGDCTIGFENISAATEAALVAIVLKKATLEAVTTTIEQVGAIVYASTGSTANTGTTSGFTVPADTEFMLVGVSTDTTVANALVSLTALKGGVDVPMVKLASDADVLGTQWQAGLFYITSPDIGTLKSLTWDWAGTAPSSTPPLFSIIFLKGVDLADPVRDSGGTQNQPFIDPFPIRTPLLTNREGDLILAWFGGYALGNATIDSWKNLTLLENPETGGFLDGAWASSSFIGSAVLGAETATLFSGGALVGVVLKPDAAVTPITPAADPPTTPRSVVTGSFTLPPELADATDVEVVGESRTISVTAGAFEDDFDEEFSYHAYKVAISGAAVLIPPPGGEGGLSLSQVPWHGGPGYWTAFPKAAAAGWTDPDFFPFGLFLSPPQEDHPANAAAAGITHYMAVEGVVPPGVQGITDDGLQAFPHMDEWSPDGSGGMLDANSPTDPLVTSWFIGDEIDMIDVGAGNHDELLEIVTDRVALMRSYDDDTIASMNIGNGVNQTFWATDPYVIDQMVQAVDLCCVDQYAYTSDQVRYNMSGSPNWPSGVSEAQGQCAGAYGWLADQMAFLQDSDNRKPYGVTVETAKPYLFPGTDPGFRTITVNEIGGAVWAAIIHGASMIMFFQHNNDDSIDNYSITGSEGTSAIRAGVAAITAEVRSVASIINTQSYVFAFGASGIDTMLKAPGDGYAYIFAGVRLGGSAGAKTFTVTGSGITGTSVEVVGESRSLSISAGAFSDSFAAEYTHHIYKIAI